MEIPFATLAESLRWRAEHRPEQTAVTFLLDGEREEASWTYRQLDARARSIAAELQRLGVAGGRVLLLHPPGLEFIAALFGCFYAGVTAVPTYPPQFNLRSRSAVRLARLVQDAQPGVALTTADNVGKAAWFAHKESGLEALRWMGTDSLSVLDGASWHPPALAPEALALIQYTSGSTSSPKGVLLSHQNLLANLAVIAAKFRHSATSRGVIWLPPYHDMGLIGGLLQPIVYGFPVVLPAPVHALQRPLRWLQAVSRYRATTSGGPNFAYDLCVRGIPLEERRRLDLSSWQVAFNGAEPVRAETLVRFTRAFAPCGFRPEAFYPCYGLAEATLFVTGGEQGTRPTTRTFDRHELVRRRAVLVPDEELKDGATATLVSCGRTHGEHDLAIVDPASGRPCAAGEVGEIRVTGPSVAQGYWDRPQESRAGFQNQLAPSPYPCYPCHPWFGVRSQTTDGTDNTDNQKEGKGEGVGAQPFLRTGDLGFVLDGELFVAGRLKDLIILRGRNYYPQDIEEAAEVSHPALLLGASAAFAVDVDGAEQVVVACEVKREERRQLDTASVLEAVRRAVAAALDLRVYGVVLLKPGSLPRTTSGKIQRNACRTAFLDKTWEPIVENQESGVSRTPDSCPLTPELDRAMLLAAPEAERVLLLRQYLTQRLVGMLKTPGHWLDGDQPLGHLGVDSLMWVELLLQIEVDLEVSIPPESVTPDLTLAELIEVMDGRLSRSPMTSALAPGERQNGSVQTGRPIPLTPLQAEFLRPGVGHPEKFSTALFLRTPTGLDAAALERALLCLERQHDAFRLRFHREGEGWRQQYADPGTAVAFRRLDVSGAKPDQLQALRKQLNEELPGAFDVSHGPLIQAAWLDGGPRQTGLLKLCLHHLVCDGLSVSIFVSGLQRAYLKCLRGEPPDALPGGLPFGEWARALEALAQTEDVRHDLRFWQDACRDLPPTFIDPNINPEQADGDAQIFAPRAELSAADHRRFLERFPAPRAQHEVLLAAFARAWRSYTGQDELFVRLESHGRQPLAGRTPATTIGWFISQYPLRLWVPVGRDEIALVGQVRSALERVPHQGRSHGLLTWLCRDAAVRAAMQELPTARLGMVYYGHLHDVFRERGLFPVIDEQSYSRAWQHDDRWPDLLLLSGQDRGTTWWRVLYRPARYSQQTAAALTAGVGAFLREICV